MLLLRSLPLLCFLNFNKPREAFKVQLTTSKVSRAFSIDMNVIFGHV